MAEHERPPSARSSHAAKIRQWVRIYWAAAVAVAVAVIIWNEAFPRSGDKGSGLIWLEIVKLCAQFFILVVLGVLLSYTMDQLKAKNADERAAQARREDHVRRLIDITHDVDLARMLISANRSVNSWSEQMKGRIIPGYTEMRDLSHDLKTAQQAGQPVFADWAKILLELLSMNEWLKNLCFEFADKREKLSSLRQGKEWKAMLTLPHLSDLVGDKDEYGAFRDTYRSVLASMRKELVMRSPSYRTPDFSPEDVMELHALNMRIWQAVSDRDRAAFGELVASTLPAAFVFDALQEKLQAGTSRSSQLESSSMARKSTSAVLTRIIREDGHSYKEFWKFVRESRNQPWKLGALEPLKAKAGDEAAMGPDG